MAQFPEEIYTPRVMTNREGVEYDPNRTKDIYAEDFNLDRDEIVAIQEYLQNDLLNIIYPVGSIYTNATDNTNPATLLGFGTWSAFGAGRVMVGFDSEDIDFNAAEKTGGAKTHILTSAELASHTHTQNAHTHTQNAHTHTQNAHTHTQNAHTHTQNAHTHTQNAHVHALKNQTLIRGALGTGSNDLTVSGTRSIGVSDALGATATNNNAIAINNNATAINNNATAINNNATAINNNATATNNNAGNSNGHNNVQPYIVVYMWKRTA